MNRNVLLIAAFTLNLLTASILPAQSVQTIGLKGIDSLIHHRNGKALLLNVWATWCVPCTEEFPDLVKLSDRLKGTNAEVVAVSVDFPDEITSKVAPFVTKMNARFPVFVADVESQDELINAFDSTWSGAVPGTFLYSPSGTKHSALFGKQSLDRLQKAVEAAAGKP